MIFAIVELVEISTTKRMFFIGKKNVLTVIMVVNIITATYVQLGKDCELALFSFLYCDKVKY